MSIISALIRPEYLLRPTRLLRRILDEVHRPDGEYETVTLPWGAPIRIRPNEAQGLCIRRRGVYDLVSNELIWRLMDAGDRAVDIGANIGHMTCAMAFKAGPKGTVFSVEPHPALFQELSHNVAQWTKMEGAAPIYMHRVAASNQAGNGRLSEPEGFGENRGLSFLTAADPPASASGACFHEVETVTLDRLLGGEGAALLKMDCEGHELEVLQGATNLLARHAIRDILFEDHGVPPTPVTRLLESSGYEVFHLDARLFGPVAVPISGPYVRKFRDVPNYLATLDSSRAISRIRRLGWAVYSAGPF